MLPGVGRPGKGLDGPMFPEGGMSASAGDEGGKAMMMKGKMMMAMKGKMGKGGPGEGAPSDGKGSGDGSPPVGLPSTSEPPPADVGLMGKAAMLGKGMMMLMGKGKGKDGDVPPPPMSAPPPTATIAPAAPEVDPAEAAELEDMRNQMNASISAFTSALTGTDDAAPSGKGKGTDAIAVPSQEMAAPMMPGLAPPPTDMPAPPMGPGMEAMMAGMGKGGMPGMPGMPGMDPQMMQMQMMQMMSGGMPGGGMPGGGMPGGGMPGGGMPGMGMMGMPAMPSPAMPAPGGMDAMMSMMMGMGKGGMPGMPPMGMPGEAAKPSAPSALAELDPKLAQAAAGKKPSGELGAMGAAAAAIQASVRGGDPMAAYKEALGDEKAASTDRGGRSKSRDRRRSRSRGRRSRSRGGRDRREGRRSRSRGRRSRSRGGDGGEEDGDAADRDALMKHHSGGDAGMDSHTQAAITSMMAGMMGGGGGPQTEEQKQQMQVFAAAAAAQQAQYLQQYQFWQQMRVHEAEKTTNRTGLPFQKDSRFKDDFRPMRLCKHLVTVGMCRQGQECTYAHIYEELHPSSPDLPKIAGVNDREREPVMAKDAPLPESVIPDVRLKKKKEMCGRLARGECSLGKVCPFAHSEEELGTVGLAVCGKVKTRLCLYWDSGKCLAGANCNHAHGEKEIGTKRPPPELAPPMKKRRDGGSVLKGR
eukprot:gnl/TRDRNA2_/TRDRNA2_135795_c0_seq1.p1 gnl/TRDRNA2_/TRDRNA2_135795_c0~~gnl/TRDRNA2_/TRDRNA2_135795_c0_seq1.p1  ORF type:complete len:696 (+),score=159.06 gnl/TRDRNA2_/TRDRNA2_135795_c0_seq1:110-2197(+)